MIKFLSSTRITVVCLFLLFILTFWGTIAQIQQGLYIAQERFFNSFFFLAGGFFPFPGAQLVLWVLFINLLCMTVLTFKKYLQWSYLGLLIVHTGLLLYFFAAFMVFHVSKESMVRLAHGQATNVSMAYDEWELAYWMDHDSKQHQVTAIDTKDFKSGYTIPFETKDFSLSVKKYYVNSEVSSKDHQLIPKPIVKDREQNIAGGSFNIRFDDKDHSMMLFGGDSKSNSAVIAGKKYYFILQHKRYPLPFTIKLDQFKAEFHPGTDVAKSYESLVSISTGTLERQVRIYMNNPLRYKDYTVYQASYDTDRMGRQYSRLAVVKNFAKILPYIACFVVFFGLAFHFLFQAFTSRVKV